MDWIQHIAFHRNIRNEEPNKELAKLLVESENKEGIKEIASFLHDKNKSIASDCIAVLYHVGYEKPQLIADYVDVFLELLSSKINRMVWGAMIAISTLAKVKATQLYQKIDVILDSIKNGTVITEVWGLVTLVNLSLANQEYKSHLFPVLCDYLEKCRPVDFAKRVETIIPIISNTEEKEILKQIIGLKTSELSAAQSKKLQTVVNKYNKTHAKNTIVL